MLTMPFPPSLQNIVFTGGYCSGGHGLSVGSVGGRDDNTVDGVSFLSSTVTDSVNGIRIKATEGDTGTITDVEYDDITLSSISGYVLSVLPTDSREEHPMLITYMYSYGILIEQNYDGGDLKGTPTSGIPITDLT